MPITSDEIRALFVLTGPENEYQEIIVTRAGVSLGRDAGNEIRIQHREISRQHLRIDWGEDNRFVVVDRNSSNGVWLNDIRLSPNVPALLNEGDSLRVGPFLLQLRQFLYGQVALVARTSGDDRLAPLAPAAITPMPGVPYDRSNWLKYLPAIYQEDEFLGRYLLIFESIFSPLIWYIDNFDLYLSPEIAPPEWLRWIAGWFDLLLLPDLEVARQRQIMQQIGWLFMRRGTHAGLIRLLELYFGVTPRIEEDEPCHFTVHLDLSQSSTRLSRDVADRLIASQKPAFASYTLHIQ
jgi:phage tail-like protein